MTNYTYIKKSTFWFYETLDEIRIAFSEKGFWVVTNLNIAEKIQKKINPDFWEYVTLGLCKPEIAYDFLKEDINLWIFMPCSVSIYEKNWEVFISAWLPEKIISPIISNKKLEKYNIEISKEMKNIINNI